MVASASDTGVGPHARTIDLRRRQAASAWISEPGGHFGKLLDGLACRFGPSQLHGCHESEPTCPVDGLVVA